jgi:hypothetical protein
LPVSATIFIQAAKRFFVAVQRNIGGICAGGIKVEDLTGIK